MMKLLGINPYVILGLAALIAALGGFGLIEHYRANAAQTKVASLELARDVEAQHAKDAQAVLGKLELINAAQASSIKKLQAAKASRDAKIAQIVKDTKNALDANQVAGPAFDALADSLRQLEAAHQ